MGRKLQVGIFVSSLHLLIERYLTTDAVIVVMILLHIDALEVDIGILAYKLSQLLFGEVGYCLCIGLASCFEISNVRLSEHFHCYLYLFLCHRILYCLYFILANQSNLSPWS